MKYPKSLVIVPTYNEKENISLILPVILSQHECIEVLVVDDNSPDGTAEIVRKLQKKYPDKVHLIVRSKERGRGTAGIRGHQEAIKLRPEYIVEMDADFSHDPQYILQFLKEIDGYDVVLGSRFIKGGKDSDRSPFRTFISILSGHIFRAILGLEIRDIGSGYKLYRREVLESLPWDNFYSYGIAISMEEIFRIVRKGYKVKEVPIIFVDRRAGQSKLKWKDFFEPVGISMKLAVQLGRV